MNLYPDRTEDGPFGFLITPRAAAGSGLRLVSPTTGRPRATSVERDRLRALLWAAAQGFVLAADEVPLPGAEDSADPWDIHLLVGSPG